MALVAAALVRLWSFSRPADSRDGREGSTSLDGRGPGHADAYAKKEARHEIKEYAQDIQEKAKQTTRQEEREEDTTTEAARRAAEDAEPGREDEEDQKTAMRSGAKAKATGKTSSSRLRPHIDSTDSVDQYFAVDSTASTQLINAPEHVVDEALHGMILAYPHLNIVKGHRVIIRSDIETYKQSHVCLISGGGSGHEPAHAGFIGDGMLSAAVAGDVFASPPASAVLAAIRACAGPNGVLVIVKNYTGDRLNFGLAVEQAKFEGHKVEMIIVADDCALPRSKSKAGRRGIAGTVLVHKILGAMASSGQDLATLKAAAERLSARLGTVGMALSSCHVPGRGPSFTLRPHIFGVGIGIHGEQGANELPFVSAKEAAKCMVDLLFNQDKDYSYLPFPTQDESKYAVLINNLGGTSPLELAVATNSVIQQLTERFGVTLSRVYSGTFMTSIAMTGFSISVLDINAFDGMDVAPVLEWLDMPAKALGWTSAIVGSIDAVSKKEPIVVKTSRPSYDQSLLSSRNRVLSKHEQATLTKAIRGACKGLLEAEKELTRLDMIAGDGDCGTTMKAGATAVQRELDAGTLQVAHPAQLAQQLSALAQSSMGGTSGALYSIFFAAASSCMHDAAVNELSLRELACLGLEAGVYAMQKYGGAHEGDRTLIDVLVPLLRYMQEASAHGNFDLRRVQELVVSKAEATKTMIATCGRASYQPDIALRGNIDPGAYAVACWVSELIDAIKS